MGIKKLKPTSPARRYQTYLTRDELTPNAKPEKSLLEPKTRISGRNSDGRITVRRRGGGHKRFYRVVDFKRDKAGIPGRVSQIEYDPNRSAHIALITYLDGEKRYIIAPVGLTVGSTIMSGIEADILPGNALIGIVVILFGNFGELETKILLTTLTVSYASILGLACGAFLETKRGKTLPVMGIVMAFASAIFWIILIWHGTIQEKLFIKLLFSTTLLAVSCSHLSLLSFARLDKKFLWSRYAAYVSVGMLTAILFWLIWSEAKDFSELISRSIGVLLIIIASLTIITPVFHKLSGGQTTEEINEEIARLKSRIDELEKQKAHSINSENESQNN